MPPATNIDALVAEMRKLCGVMQDVRLLTAMQLLTSQMGSFAATVSPVSVSSVGASGSGSLVYRNEATRPITVIVRDRGGNSQTMWVSKDSGMASGEGFTTATTVGVTTESDPVILLSNEALFSRVSTTAVVVDALILDPIALLRRLRAVKE